MFRSRWKGPRKRRTREHVIEEMSVNFLERKVLQRGHMLVRSPQREYGWDATMFHFSPDPDRQTIELQIPWSNQVTVRAIDRFREMSLARIKDEG